MKRLLAALTFLAFLAISQAGFIHALDMRIMHDDKSMSTSEISKSEEPVFCAKSNFGDTKGCFQEIPESKWITSMNMKVLEVFSVLFFVISIIIHFGDALEVSTSQGYLKILGPPKNEYLSLTGIIRNLN